MYESPYTKEETDDLIKQVNELRLHLAMCWSLLPDGEFSDADKAVKVKKAMTKYQAWPENVGIR